MDQLQRASEQFIMMSHLNPIWVRFSILLGFASKIEIGMQPPILNRVNRVVESRSNSIRKFTEASHLDIFVSQQYPKEDRPVAGRIRTDSVGNVRHLRA